MNTIARTHHVGLEIGDAFQEGFRGTPAPRQQGLLRTLLLDELRMIMHHMSKLKVPFIVNSAVI